MKFFFIVFILTTFIVTAFANYSTRHGYKKKPRDPETASPTNLDTVSSKASATERGYRPHKKVRQIESNSGTKGPGEVARPGNPTQN